MWISAWCAYLHQPWGASSEYAIAAESPTHLPGIAYAGVVLAASPAEPRGHQAAGQSDLYALTRRQQSVAHQLWRHDDL
jgi:hypothetical protein